MGCLAGIRNYLKFNFDVAKPNTVTAYVANWLVPEQLTFKILTTEERALEQESAEEERLWHYWIGNKLSGLTSSETQILTGHLTGSSLAKIDAAS